MSVKTLRELNPTNRSQVERAKTAIQSKNYDYAITLLQAVLKDEPIYLEGRKVLRAAEITKYKATGTLTRQMTNMRTSTLAMKLSTKKAPAEQLIAAEEILQSDPFNMKANVAIGDAGTALGCPELRCFAYETLVSSKPDGDKSAIPLMHTLAKAYMEMKAPDMAEKTYQRILDIDSRDGDAISGIKDASAALSHTKWDDAQKTEDFRAALKSKDESEQLETESKIVKSADAIEEQIQVNYQRWQEDAENPTKASVHAKKIGQLYEQRNEFAHAIPWFQAAFEAGGSVDSSLEQHIGDLRLKAGESEIHELQEAMAQQPDAEAQKPFEDAIAQKEADLNKLRLDLAEARVKAHPNDGEFRFMLGEALFKDGQYKRATEELQQAINAAPNIRYPALNLLGLAFMKRGMTDFAISRLLEADNELPDMTQEIKKEITYNLGLAYEADKQPDKALEQWKKIYVVAMNYRDVAARVEASYGNGG